MVYRARATASTQVALLMLAMEKLLLVHLET